VTFTGLEIAGVGRSVHLTASFGVSEWRRGESYGALFARADRTLYEAKAAGRNRVLAEGEQRTVVSLAEAGGAAA
jgi:PleD family two-component response regulator